LAKCFIPLFIDNSDVLFSEQYINATWQTVHCVFILCSEKNVVVGQDQKILTDEQPAIEGNKGAPELKNFLC
jgi:hypothetical protein